MLELIPAVLYGILTLVSVLFAIKLQLALKRFKMKRLISEPTLLHDLPSVSVCIPARNETAVMSQCLERVIASTYPKLEIIVLDDGSGDNTSHLIKAFAHSGVRFVEGTKLGEGWLGKNHALQGLLNEASGSLVFFMDVDTHIKPDTIEQLVSYMRQDRISMVSVLPLRVDGWRTSVLLSTMLYFWELILSTRRRPASTSTAWMIDRTVLVDEFDGFNRIKNHIKPESIIAAVLYKIKRYNFLVGTELLGISYEKKWSSQANTSVRLLYPMTGGRLIGGVIGVFFLVMLNLPTVFIIDGLLSGWTVTHIIALWQTCLFIAIYAQYVGVVWKRGWWVGALLWPYIVVQELVLLIISIHRYMSHSVTWKGRPITTSLRAK